MKKTIILLTAILLFSGCAGLITHGEITSGNYKSISGGYSIETPKNWKATISPPSSSLENVINSKLIRTREVGYLIKNDNSAVILIETHALTWGGRPLLTLDVTWDENGPEKFNSGCMESCSNEKEKSASKFNSFTFQCVPLKPHKDCQINMPCLELVKEMQSSEKDGQIILEKSYIFDDKRMAELMFAKDKTANGWRVHFTLMSPPNDYEANKEIMDQVINTMRKQ